jgi:hypothetical protein
MTIPAGQTSITRHTGNGTADTFDYEFKITDQTELLVTITDTNGVATVQALTTDYTVSGVGDNDGGSITLVAGALTTGYTITLEDNVQASQLTPYGNQSAFFGSNHENSFDKATRLVKRALDDAGNALHLRASVSGVSTEIPDPEALNLLRWNAAATSMENVSAGDIGSTLATSNWVVERFVDGTDYTAGTTTQLTLTQSPAVIQNTWVFFDGAVHHQSEYSLAGQTITFDVAIPIGTSVVEVRQNEALPQSSVDANSVLYNATGAGSVQRTGQNKFDEAVSVRDFGAIGDGVADDSSAFTAAFAASNLVFGENGDTYLLNEVTYASGQQQFDGRNCIIKPAAGSKYALRMNQYHPQLRNTRFTDPDGNCVFQTTLGSNAAALATSITVADGSGIDIEDQIYIWNDNNRWNRSRVTNVVGNTITLSDGIDVASTSGDKVWATKGCLFVDQGTYHRISNVHMDDVWSGIYVWGSGVQPNDCAKGIVSRVSIQDCVLAGITVAGNVHDWQWDQIEIWAGVSQTENFTGDGATTSYTLEYPVWRDNDQDITVKIDSVAQTEGTDYTHTNEMTINFNTAPSNGADIEVTRYRQGARGIVFDSRGVTGAFGADGISNVYVLGAQIGVEVRRGRVLAQGLLVDSIQDTGLWIDEVDRSFFQGCAFLFSRTPVHVTGSSGGAENIRFSSLRTTFVTAASNGLLGTETGASFDVESGSAVTVDWTTYWGPNRGLTGAGTVRRAPDQIFARADKDATEPAYAFENGVDTGMFNVGTDELGLAAAGVRRVYVKNNGDVGIGDTYSPSYRLDVDGDVNVDTGQRYRVNGTAVLDARQTGWGAPTGTADRATFATSSVTLSELAERVKALIDDLTTHGIIGS